MYQLATVPAASRLPVGYTLSISLQASENDITTVGFQAYDQSGVMIGQVAKDLGQIPAYAGNLSAGVALHRVLEDPAQYGPQVRPGLGRHLRVGRSTSASASSRRCAATRSRPSAELTTQQAAELLNRYARSVGVRIA